MLKDIRIHLEEDEEKQKQLEQALSEHIVLNHRRNILAFSRHIPSLASDVKNVNTQHISIFANKSGEYNIVDYGTGRTVYGLHPSAEVQQQYESFKKHARCLQLNERVTNTPTSTNEGGLEKNDQKVSDVTALSSYNTQMGFEPLPENINVMVVFGLGLGYHIEHLVEHHNIKHLIIYEPERQYFQCSVLTLNWHRLLSKMEAKGTSVFLQLGQDGRDVVDNISELNQHVSVDSFYFYKHYNHAIFDCLDRELRAKTWSQLKKDGLNLIPNQNPNLFLPTWSESLDLDNVSAVDKNDQLFMDNLAAFEKYFPNIHKEFKDYIPRDWLPIRDENKQINLVQKESLAAFAGREPKFDASESLKYFQKFPQKDGLVLGYTGTKLKHYKHYQFVEKTQALLNDISEDLGQLPERVKSLIMFGVGVGYQLETLFQHHDVEKLFLCEPNRDFFYASLYAIDWAAILTKVDQENYRIYINIGDDGSNLFRDLLNQFYAIGPYLLASTYFYQTYHNPYLSQALVQLREQLQIVISMGEYFDHALYGISHTTETITRGYPLLQANPSQYLNIEQKETPVFIVGNGPSLDTCIEAIKEWGDRAIVVSCGTALMPLHKNGIVPDFHAEIEQNRSTFDWVCRIGDFDYLKKISLISCNGIHPDTCDLFKDVFIAFKAGESSTVSALNILGRKNYEELEHAFPTVTNFVVNLFTKIGFNQLYLFGIDLGFIDRKKHHSINSGYYKEDGNEAYDYSKENNTSLIVPGNFEKAVFTKHEFKVSKEILEQVLAKVSVDCFNCSNGAKIRGTLPLEADNILLVNDVASKINTLRVFKQAIYKPAFEPTNYANRFTEQYRSEDFVDEIDKFLKLVKEPVTSTEQIEKLVEQQKIILFKSYKKGRSLLFYLLYGSTNYCNVLLSKCEGIDDSLLATVTKSLLEYWAEFLFEVKGATLLFRQNFDHSNSFITSRQQIYFKYKVAQALLVSNIQQDEMIEKINYWFAGDNMITGSLISKNGRALPNRNNFTNTLFYFWVTQQSEVDQLIEYLNQNTNPRSHIIWFGDNITELDFSSLSLTSTIIIHPSHVSNNDDFMGVIKGDRAHWQLRNMPQIVVRFCSDLDYVGILIPKVLIARIPNSACVLKSLYTLALTKVTQYSYYLEYIDYIVFADNLDMERNMINALGDRGSLNPISAFKPETLLFRYLRNDELNKLMKSS